MSFRLCLLAVAATCLMSTTHAATTSATPTNAANTGATPTDPVATSPAHPRPSDEAVRTFADQMMLYTALEDPDKFIYSLMQDLKAFLQELPAQLPDVLDRLIRDVHQAYLSGYPHRESNAQRVFSDSFSGEDGSYAPYKLLFILETIIDCLPDTEDPSSEA